MKLIIFILSTFLFISCNTEPQPLVEGKDECYFCKMPVADTRFGGEIITKKGKAYKFDDIGCMIDFLKRGLPAGEKVEKTLTMHYNNNKKLIAVSEAVFLRSSNIHSPMNSGVAAFESRQEAELLSKDFPSEILTWEQLLP